MIEFCLFQAEQAGLPPPVQGVDDTDIRVKTEQEVLDALTSEEVAGLTQAKTTTSKNISEKLRRKLSKRLKEHVVCRDDFIYNNVIVVVVVCCCCFSHLFLLLLFVCCCCCLFSLCVLIAIFPICCCCCLFVVLVFICDLVVVCSCCLQCFNTHIQLRFKHVYV